MDTRIYWTRVYVIAAMTIAAVALRPAQAVPTAEQKCEAGKNIAAGKLAACLEKAEKSLALGADMLSYTEARTNCQDKAESSWTKLEAAAIDAGVACPSTGDQAAIENFVDACVQSVADALGGGSLGPDPATCTADLAVCNSDLTTCNGGLSTCTSNLSTCNGDLSSCNGTLSACNGTLSVCNSDLTTCTGGLSTCNNDLATASSNLTTCTGNLGTCSGNLSTCQVDLAACQAAPSGGGLLETGQTLCHNASNVVTPCAGTGQDGEFQMGAARSFTDNNDGTITDNATGLMWEKLSDAGGIHDYDTAYNWTGAFGKVATLNTDSFAGYTDWRLPNVVELESLKNFSTFNPTAFSAFHNLCSGGCSTCSCTYAGLEYWTSTTMASSAGNALQVSFNAGDTSVAQKFNLRVVRAVRGGL